MGFAAALLISSNALADKPTPEGRRARALFDEGVALSDEGKWSDALAAFQRSDDLVRSASVRLNIGVTLRALGRYVEAQKTLRRILVEEKSFVPPLKPALKKDVEKLLAEVSAKIVTLSLRLRPTDADVQADGSPITTLPDGRIAIDPGRHVFVLKASGYDTTTVTQTIAASDTEIILTAPQTKVVERRVEVPKATPVYARGWFLATAGALVLGGAAAVIIFVAQPKTPALAGPPPSTVDRVVPAGFRF